jgi:catechol 1,2-dioxygenase
VLGRVIPPYLKDEFMNISQRNDQADLLNYFDPDRSADVVNNRMTEKASPRVAEIMTVLVKHLHAAVREARLTPDEWMAGIQFLTDTGQICSDWRQEFILLSDVLGVSMLVDAINHDRPAGATENTVLGPFHISNAPHYALGADISLDGKGEPMIVAGTVRDIQGRPVCGATLDVWQANDDGFYDVQQKGIQPEWNLRGIFTTDDEGRYWFRSVKPRYYPIPDDGPVGKLLKLMGRHPNRAAHLHFIVKASGFDPVVTHIFTPDCQYLAEDAVFGVKKSLIADFQWVTNEKEAPSSILEVPNWYVNWDFVLSPL